MFLTKSNFERTEGDAQRPYAPIVALRTAHFDADNRNALLPWVLNPGFEEICGAGVVGQVHRWQVGLCPHEDFDHIATWPPCAEDEVERAHPAAQLCCRCRSGDHAVDAIAVRNSRHRVQRKAHGPRYRQWFRIGDGCASWTLCRWTLHGWRFCFKTHNFMQTPTNQCGTRGRGSKRRQRVQHP
eukprot:587-Prorocentrum_minimum.AAC.4